MTGKTLQLLMPGSTLQQVIAALRELNAGDVHEARLAMSEVPAVDDDSVVQALAALLEMARVVRATRA